MLKVPSTIHKIETMSDGGLKLTVYTQELDPTDEAEVMKLKRQLGMFVFSVTEQIKESDIPDVKVEFANDKTPSQRLRNVLFRAWEQDNGGYKDFELYYRNKIEKFIDFVKEKLS